MRSETTLKTWEHHIEESKMLEKEVKAACLSALLSIEDKMEEIDLGEVHLFLETIKVGELAQSLKEKREKYKEDIQKINFVTLPFMNDFLVKPIQQVHVTQREAEKMQNSLSVVDSKAFNFEFNATIESPKFLTELLKTHAQIRERQTT
jgi:hypothetical protein